MPVLVHQIGGNTTSTTGDQRSLTQMVQIVDGKATPFSVMVKKVGIPKPESMVHEWPLDLEEPIQDLAVTDGRPAGPAENAQESYTMLAGRLQLNRTVKGVSILSEYQNQAGIPNKKAYARMKALKQLGQSREALLLSPQEVQVGTGLLPNKLRGVGNWLVTSQATSGYSIASDFLPDSSQIVTTATASVTAAVINGVMGATWARGGIGADESYWCLCGRLFKQQVSTLTGYASGTDTYQSSRSYNADLTKKILWQTIDTFIGDWGKAEFAPSLLLDHAVFGGSQNSRYAYGLCVDAFELLEAGIEKEKELAYDGSGWQAEFKEVIGLRCKNPRKNWAIKSAS